MLSKVGVTYQAAERILAMIDWVSCSKNGNTVPEFVLQNEKYQLLIPRWSDCLEAAGKQGAFHCYQHAKDCNQALSGDASPRPTSEEEIWQFATPQRFQDYQTKRKGGSHDDVDMISHCYDKLLHVAKPPPGRIVQNEHLEQKAKEGMAPLIEVCLRFGKSGVADEECLKSLQTNRAAHQRALNLLCVSTSATEEASNNVQTALDARWLPVPMETPQPNTKAHTNERIQSMENSRLGLA